MTCAGSAVLYIQLVAILVAILVGVALQLVLCPPLRSPVCRLAFPAGSRQADTPISLQWQGLLSK